MKRSKRILSAILVVLLLASTLNGFVFAAGETEPEVTYVSNYSDFVAALNANKKNIVLNNDIEANAGVTYEYDSANKKIIVKNGDGEQIAQINATDGSVVVDTTNLNDLTKWSTRDLNGVTIDGNEHKIIGLYTTGGAMFGTVDKDSKIKNLKFVNALSINNTQANVGIVAGQLNGDIENISVEGAVVLTYGEPTTSAYCPHIGGVVGSTRPTTADKAPKIELKCPEIKNVTFSGDVIAANTTNRKPSIGGIIGQLRAGKILNCANYGNVTALSGEIYGLGGIAGLVESHEASVDNVNAGLVGNNYVLNSANYGTVTNLTGKTSINVGGVIGQSSLSWAANSKAWYRNLYNVGNIYYYDGTDLVKTGNGIIGNFGKVDEGKIITASGKTYAQNFIDNGFGIAEYLICDVTATVGSPQPVVNSQFTTKSHNETLNAYTATYYFNCNAANVDDGACAWKVENTVAVLDFNTPAGDAVTPVRPSVKIDAFDLNIVKYYDIDDKNDNDIVAELIEDTVTANKADTAGKWRRDNGSHLDGYSAIASTKAGNSFEVRFTGDSVEWHTKYRDGKLSNMEVYLDGKLIDTVDGTRIGAKKTPNVGNLVDYIIFAAYGLDSSKEHSLHCVFLENSTTVLDFLLVGTEGLETVARECDGYKYIDAEHHLHLFKGSTTEGFAHAHSETISFRGSTFCPCEIVDSDNFDYVKYFDKDGKPVSSVDLQAVIDSNPGKDSSITKGGWGSFANSAYYKGRLFRSNTAGVSFEVVFEGTGIEWWTDFRDKTMADVEISIDDNVVATLNGVDLAVQNYDNGIHISNHQIYEVNDLDEGIHTFKVKSLKDKLMVIDYFKIIGGSAVKSTVAPEAVKDLVYNGDERTGVVGVKTCVGDDVHYTLSGETEETDAGSYTATATLADGYVWSDDGTTNERHIPWSIAKKPVTVTANDKNVEYGGDLPEEYYATVVGLIEGDTLDYKVTCDDADSNTIDTFAITVTGEEEQGNYLVTYVPGTLTVEHTHTKGNDIMSNSAAHWYACDNCPRLGEVGDYEAAFEADPALKDTLGYEEHHFDAEGCCIECGRAALPDGYDGYYTELEVNGITYNDNKTISVAFNVSEFYGNPINMQEAAPLAVYASKDANVDLIALKENELLENVGYVLTYDEDNGDAIVTFDYDYKFVSIGIKNSNIALNPMEFFMLDDGLENDTDDKETKLGNWITCDSTLNPAHADFDFVFFTTRDAAFSPESKLLTTDTDDVYSYGDGYYQISLFNNAMLINRELLTSKYLRVAALTNDYYEVKLQLVAQDVGGMLGHQEKLDYSGMHRILAPITEQEALDIDCVRVLGWYGENLEHYINYTIDCAYTEYYEGDSACDASAIRISDGIYAFAVIIIDGDDESHNGYNGPIYVRIYSEVKGEQILFRDGVYIPELYFN